jgi:hypothetical protein
MEGSGIHKPLPFLFISPIGDCQDFSHSLHFSTFFGRSGTADRPKRLVFTRSDQEMTIGFFRVGMSTFTALGDRVPILLPVERPGSVGDPLAVALERRDYAASGMDRYGM